MAHRRYEFKLYPTAEIAEALTEHIRLCVDLWNALLDFQENIYDYRKNKRDINYYEKRPPLPFYEPKRRTIRTADDTKPLPLRRSYNDLTSDITGLVRECPEFKALPQICLQRVAKHLIESFAAYHRRLEELKSNPALRARKEQHFFERRGRKPTLRQLAGYPQHHSRWHATTIPLGAMWRGTGWKLLQREDNPRSWHLHYGSLTNPRDTKTWIHARGALPIDPTTGETVEVLEWLNGDIIYRDQQWWLSICVNIENRREVNRANTESLDIQLELFDTFAIVNGSPDTPVDLNLTKVLSHDVDVLKSEFDTRFPRGKRLSDEEKADRRELNLELNHRRERLRRRRANAMHVWTTRIVKRASDITLRVPKLDVKSGRGNEKTWGANIETAATVNRNTFHFAPFQIIQMTKYKCEEFGIRCDIVEDTEPTITAVNEVVVAGKMVRKSQRGALSEKDADKMFKMRVPELIIGASNLIDANIALKNGDHSRGTIEIGRNAGRLVSAVAKDMRAQLIEPETIMAERRAQKLREMEVPSSETTVSVTTSVLVTTTTSSKSDKSDKPDE